MKIAIFGNEYQSEFLPHIIRLFKVLADRGAEVIVENNYFQHLAEPAQQAASHATVANAKDISADIAISLGGDGTFLRTAQAMAQKGIPIIGINTGHLGYLTAAGVEEIGHVADELLINHYRIENRSMLQVSCSDVTIDNPFALNEIAILRKETSAAICMNATRNGYKLANYRGDGLVVATPTGSTAYNLSCGGPIIEPTTSNIVVTPVSPHALTLRPLVLRDDSRIEVTTQSRSQSYQLSIDGRTVSCPSGSTISIAKAPFSVKVILRHGQDFAQKLRTKLLWGK